MNIAKPLLLIAAAAVVPILVMNLVVEPMQLDAAKEAALAVVREQEKAWNNADLPGFLKGYEMSEEITFYSDDKIAKGWVSLNDRFTKKYASNPKLMGKLQFTDLIADPMNAETVLIRGKWATSDCESPNNGLFTILVKKTATGWKVTHDHTSAKAKPENK